MTRFKQLLVGRNPRRTLVRAVFAAAAAFLVFGYVIRPVRVQGISMEPTIRDGTYHLVNLLHYHWNEPRRGDMAAIAMPGRRSYYMKRILALPGETVAFVNGDLLINGERLEEPYLAASGDWSMSQTNIPEGHYFIAGDNRDTSFRLHTLGIVRRDQLAGILWK